MPRHDIFIALRDAHPSSFFEESTMTSPTPSTKTVRRRIYVASSWRNPQQPAVVERLRAEGHEVYDFRNPAPGQKGFHWSDCGGEASGDGPGRSAKTISSYLEALGSDRAAEGFELDFQALEWCDTCILLLPSGRSAHLEVGYIAGMGKDTFVLLDEHGFEPELMYLLNDYITTDIEQVVQLLDRHNPTDIRRWHDVNGAHFTRPAGHALRLLREVVEFCVAAGASQDEIMVHTMEEINKALERNEFSPDGTMQELSTAAEELADCQILITVFASRAGINLTHEVRHKAVILWGREWEAGKSGALYRVGRVPQHEQVEGRDGQ